jgi:uncharacterized protein YxjI
MKNLKTFEEYNTNEGLKTKLATIALGSVLACTTPSCNIDYNKPTTEQKNVVDLNKFSNFSIEETVMSIGDNFIVSSNNLKICKIKEKILSLTPSFKMYDMSDNLLAYDEVEFLSFNNVIKIYDAKHIYLGKIEQEIFENILSIENTYSLFDDKDNKIGTSRKLELLSTKIHIYDNNKEIVNMKRPAFNIISDTWNLNINSNIDRRLILFIPCYKTYYDNISKDDK